MVTGTLGWAPLHPLKVDENMNWKTGSLGGKRGSERMPRLLNRGVSRTWDVTECYWSVLCPGFTHSCELTDLVGRHDLGEQDSFEMSEDERVVYFQCN